MGIDRPSAVAIVRGLAAVLAMIGSAVAHAELAVQSARDLYRISVAPLNATVPLRGLHAWTVRLETADGVVFMPTALTIDGGMPGHGHGLPTVPQPTRLLPSGALLVEGVSFNMSGRWQLRFAIEGPAGRDSATVDFDVGSDGRLGGDSASEDSRPTLLRSLALTSLGPVPPDATNRVADDASAAAFGRQLFRDPRFSATGTLSCESCHVPEQQLTDGRARAHGIAQTARNTPDLVGAAWRPWLYWDGRRDSLWAQALIPLEAPSEMGGSRVGAIHIVAGDRNYRARYEALFGAPPDVRDLPPAAGPLGNPDEVSAWSLLSETRRKEINRAFSNIGKALAAFERKIAPVPGRFDAYVAGSANFTRDEAAGLALFLDQNRTTCLRCHNGPLFTNQGFHNIGTGRFAGADLDFGRMFGIQAVVMDEFNCLGPYSDGTPDDCAQLRHTPRDEVPDEMAGAFKVPGLRNLVATAPYMHDGRYTTLDEVIEHYRKPPSGADAVGELTPISITDDESRQLVAFLKTLDGGYRILD